MTPFSYCSSAICAALVVLTTGSWAANPPKRHLVILHQFTGADGSGPIGPLVQDASGNLYGETEIGGSNSGGVAYELSRQGSQWNETVLHNFSMADGVNPLGGLTLDDQGNLYGTEFTGADFGGGVFEISPGGAGVWNFTQLYTFTGLADSGSNPYGGVLRDESGNLYGTTYYGGAKFFGTVFELSSTQGQWTPTVLHSFKNKPDGAYPTAAIIRDAAGNFYGTTSQGGNGHCGDHDGDKAGCGTLFMLQSSQRGFTETQLYAFQNDEPNGPYAPLTLGPGGVLYGTASYDVFELIPQSGGGWQKQVIYQFKEGEAGTITSSGVTVDSAGNLYGTTQSSGLNGYGSVYELSPPAQGSQQWTHHTLARIGSGISAGPQGGILIGSDSTLYGVANGGSGYVFAIR